MNLEETYAEIVATRKEADVKIAALKEPFQKRLEGFAYLFGADADIELNGFEDGPTTYYRTPWLDAERLILVNFTEYGRCGDSDSTEAAYFPLRWMTDNVSLDEAKAELKAMRERVKAQDDARRVAADREAKIKLLERLQKELDTTTSS